MEKLYQNNEIKVLVVDDNPQNIQIIGRNLLEQDYNISYATDGFEALKILNSDTLFDLVLLDILMPEMDGFEVFREIKKNPKFKSVSIIFLSAKSDSKSVIKGLKLGANDYITKPFNADELLLRVKTQVDLKKHQEKIEQINQVLEKKVLEKTRELRFANEKLSMLEKSKSDFLKLVSHEMRTPLNIINGFSEILSESLKGTEHYEEITSLKNSSDRLISLADTALLITEIQLGKYTLDFEKIDFERLCYEATKFCLQIYPEKTFTFQYTLNKKEWDIFGDFDLLKNILCKIIENSMIACNNNGQISFSLIDSERDITLEIRDNGPGFDDEDMGKLFGFFAKEGPDSDHDGFGLGLAAVKLVMDLHSGQVVIKNLEEGGALVCLVFEKEFNQQKL